MRIAYVINTYPRPSHTFIRREITALERRGVTVDRFAMRGVAHELVDPDDIAEHARTEHVLSAGMMRLGAGLVWGLGRKHFLSALRLALRCGAQGASGGAGTGGRLRHLIYLAEAAHVARRCLELDVTHLHAHFGTNAATVAMLAARLAELPYSFTVHGPEEFDAPRALSLTEKLESARFTVAISNFGRSQLMRWCGADHWPRLKVVHCGIEPERFANPAPLPDTGRRMINIGRFSEQKGQMLLLQALAQAVRSQQDLHLTLVGDGELRPKIERAISELALGPHVTLTGWLDEAGVRAELARAHALVLPSFAEGLPMVIMEAMAAARPVIATFVAGVPELVQPGKTGWLVPAGDVTSLSGAMITFARTPLEDLAEMGQSARRRVLERHDINRSAALLETHFTRTDGPSA